jgi:HK97 family phage major capsid protein
MRRDDVRRLAEQQASLHADMLELNGATIKENRSFSAEESEKYDKMVKDFEELGEQRSRAEKLLVQDREVQHTLHTPVEQRVMGSGTAGADSLVEWRKAQGYVAKEDAPEYRDAFWHHLSANWTELDVEEQRALSKGTTTAGGFLVPTSMANDIIRSSRDMGAIASLCNEIRTEGGETLNLPANTVHGTASWTAEPRATRRRMRRSRTCRSARTSRRRRSSSPRSSSRTPSSGSRGSSRPSSVSVSACSRTRRS